MAHVASLVHDASRRLREMSVTEAADRIGELRDSTKDAWARFELDAYADSLRHGGPQPFSHPYEWASFYVMGHGELALGRTGEI